jgi:hypothetical protein
MAAEQAADLIPPENLRPAQLGIVFLGRVVLGHLSATIADLAHRGVVTVAEAPGDDWLLTDLRGRSPGPSTLLSFEKSLLDGLFAGRAEVTLSDLGPGLIDTLDRTRRSLRRDAVRRGWLGRGWMRGLRSNPRTPRGEQLITSNRQFRRELRALAASGDLERRPDLVPYAMIFGLAPGDEFGFAADHPGDTAQRRDTGVPWSQASTFGLSWTNVCDLAAHRGGHGHWGHDGHGGHSDHGGYSGYGGHSGHGGFSGHDGGGFHAG